MCADQGGTGGCSQMEPGRSSRRTRDLVAAGAPAFPEAAGRLCEAPLRAESSCCPHPDFCDL